MLAERHRLQRESRLSRCTWDATIPTFSQSHLELCTGCSIVPVSLASNCTHSVFFLFSSFRVNDSISVSLFEVAIGEYSLELDYGRESSRPRSELEGPACDAISKRRCTGRKKTWQRTEKTFPGRRRRQRKCFGTALRHRGQSCQLFPRRGTKEPRERETEMEFRFRERRTVTWPLRVDKTGSRPK